MDNKTETGINIPGGTKIESQPRPKVDPKVIETAKSEKEKSKATNQIITKNG